MWASYSTWVVLSVKCPSRKNLPLQQERCPIQQRDVDRPFHDLHRACGEVQAALQQFKRRTLVFIQQKCDIEITLRVRPMAGVGSEQINEHNIRLIAET